jgi:hypothetical protein
VKSAHDRTAPTVTISPRRSVGWRYTTALIVPPANAMNDAIFATSLTKCSSLTTANSRPSLNVTI